MSQVNKYRFDDESLSKTLVTPPRFYKLFIALRLSVMVIAALILILPLLIIRFAQRLFGWRNREFFILKIWGRIACWSVGVRPRIYGKVMKHGGVVVANHASPIDTLVLFAAMGGYMMPKSEVRSWPVIGWFTKVVGSQFLERSTKKAGEGVTELTARLKAGDIMVFHPEGTTTDGLRVLPFRSTLFAALIAADAGSYIQPVTLFYHVPEGASDNFYGWWGTQSLGDYVNEVVGIPGHRDVEVHFGTPIAVEGDRKALALAAETQVRAKLTERIRAREAKRADHQS